MNAQRSFICLSEAMHFVRTMFGLVLQSKLPLGNVLQQTQDQIWNNDLYLELSHHLVAKLMYRRPLVHSPQRIRSSKGVMQEHTSKAKNRIATQELFLVLNIYDKHSVSFEEEMTEGSGSNEPIKPMSK